MVRIDGGFIVLNYQAYRERDYTAAKRQRRFRQRHKNDAKNRNAVTPVTRNASNAVTSRNVTQAEAEVEVPPTAVAVAGARDHTRDAREDEQQQQQQRLDRFEGLIARISILCRQLGMPAYDETAERARFHRGELNIDVIQDFANDLEEKARKQPRRRRR